MWADTNKASAFYTSRYSFFDLETYIREHEGFVHVEQFNATPSDGDALTIYESLSDQDGNKNFWCLQLPTNAPRKLRLLVSNEITTYNYMSSLRFDEKFGYVAQMSTVINRLYTIALNKIPRSDLLYNS